jgi:hypothetical protein
MSSELLRVSAKKKDVTSPMLEFLISCVYIESNMDECIISFVKKKTSLCLLLASKKKGQVHTDMALSKSV